jgi:hypothetical protein
MLDADPRARHCDGAVTCALLAAECALKATLIFGHGVAYDDEVPPSVHARVFRGSGGHDLVRLYQEQPQAVRVIPLPVTEITRLSGRHRYRHRYGHVSPPRSEASAVLDDSQVVIQWMKGVLT